MSRQPSRALPGAGATPSPAAFPPTTRPNTRPNTRRQLLADLALLLVALVWGSTFVMVKDAVAAYPVFSFLALRFAFATAALLPLAWLRREKGEGRREKGGGWAGRWQWAAPGLIGVALFAGYGFQTAGLQATTAAKAGFITGLSVVIVPLASALLLRQLPGRTAWLGVALATAGLGLLTLQAGLRVNPGDLLVFACALAFAAHILLTGRFAAQADPLRLTLGQIVVVAVLSLLAAALLERPPLPSGPVLAAAAFTGVLATSAAFGIQTLAQRFTSATHTALVFTAEPVFAGFFSFLLAGEVLGPRQVAGAALILCGMLVAELRREQA